MYTHACTHAHTHTCEDAVPLLCRLCWRDVWPVLEEADRQWRGGGPAGEALDWNSLWAGHAREASKNLFDHQGKWSGTTRKSESVLCVRVCVCEGEGVCEVKVCTCTMSVSCLIDTQYIYIHVYTYMYTYRVSTCTIYYVYKQCYFLTTPILCLTTPTWT